MQKPLTAFVTLLKSISWLHIVVQHLTYCFIFFKLLPRQVWHSFYWQFEFCQRNISSLLSGPAYRRDGYKWIFLFRSESSSLSTLLQYENGRLKQLNYTLLNVSYPDIRLYWTFKFVVDNNLRKLIIGR